MALVRSLPGAVFSHLSFSAGCGDIWASQGGRAHGGYSEEVCAALVQRFLESCEATVNSE
eukprot:599791-Amphidinium_carterae.1